MKGQLTLRGVAIGCVGCAVITAASVYTALKMGALPWPIVFAAIVSLFFLKAIGKGKASLNEANVTHTVMSAGAMVAGGLAFTIPGAWMLGMADQIGLLEMLVVALSGVALGLVSTALIRRHFIEDAQIEFPIGQAAAQTLIAGDSGGATGKKLFGAMGVAGVFAFLRDALGVIPSLALSLPIPGIVFGVYVSPMMLAVGFLVGTGAVVVWFLGAVLGSFGIVVGGTAAGLWDTATAQGIVSSLGMGVMMGCGLAVVAKDVLPKAASLLRRGESFGKGHARTGAAVGLAALAVAAVALMMAMALGFGPVVSVVVVLLAFVTTAMSAQSVGQTGIDPMEIFGLIVLLVVAAFSDVSQVQLFFVAAVVAVACGLAGDVMNDFKAGWVLGTSPKAQLLGQAVGGVLGAVVSVAVMIVLLEAYGAEAFGPQGAFVAAQASVVATMVSGIPCVPAFVFGLVAGFALYCVGFPSMMLGLGIYLPFYLSLTAFLGAMAKVAYDAVAAWKARNLGGEASIASATSSDADLSSTAHANAAPASARAKAAEETGLVVASGLLGGESIVGIVLALVVAFGGMGL